MSVKHGTVVPILQTRPGGTARPEPPALCQAGPGARVSTTSGDQGRRVSGVSHGNRNRKEDEELKNAAGLAELHAIRRKCLGHYDFMHCVSDKILEAL